MTLMIENARDNAPEGLPGFAWTRFEQTVPRHLVHRAAVSEVFVTDLSAVDDRTFELGAQWSRSHTFYGPKSGRHDALILVETIRQATLVIAHQMFDVPLDAHFVLQEISYEIEEAGLRLDDQPTNIDLVASAHDVQRRGKQVVGMTIEYRCRRDRVEVGAGAIRWRCVSPAVYNRIRGDREYSPPQPAQRPCLILPHLVGRQSEADVVLAATPTERTWLLHVDVKHPVMFDHRVDHVPGMVAVEAIRQAAQLVGSRPGTAVPFAGRFTFSHYIELDEPCEVVAEPPRPDGSAGHEVGVVLQQGGQTAVQGDLWLRE